MSKLKLSIEIESDIYETLKNQMKDGISGLGEKINTVSVEQYIEGILISYVKSAEQIKKMGDKFGDLFGKLSENLGDVDLSDIFGGKDDLFKKKEENTAKKAEEEQKKTSGLKN
ncbi:hypothetical protein Barb6_03678 [Bacteroidales bacterium Barb6]|nr:hypothetical protein Barb6_03678 [Bacteroidales bacterium Barb6]